MVLAQGLMEEGNMIYFALLGVGVHIFFNPVAEGVACLGLFPTLAHNLWAAGVKFALIAPTTAGPVWPRLSLGVLPKVIIGLPGNRGMRVLVVRTAFSDLLVFATRSTMR